MKLLAAVAALVALSFAPDTVAAPSAPVTMLAPTAATPLAEGNVQVSALVRGSRAAVLVDGRFVRRLDSPCAPYVLDERVSLAPGKHVVVVASQGIRVGRVVEIDPSAPRPERNRAEQAATPSAFACLSRSKLVVQPGNVLGRSDRVVLVRGGSVRTLTQAQLGLRRTGARSYSFRPIAGAFSLRVGSSWGALDARGRRAYPVAAEDSSRAASGTVGKAGGSVSVTDAAGVVATLAIPPGALARDTAIRVVPLAGSALVGGSPAQPGLRFEPDGLVFSRPAVLTLDYSKSTHRVVKADRVSLATSPLTALPLPGRVDLERQLVTGLLPHFSTTVGGLTEAEFSDLTAWADAILSADDRPTLTEIATLMGLLADQQATGCDDDCIEPQSVQTKATVAIGGLDQQACALDIGEPSDAAVQRWMALTAVAQAVGVDAERPLGCAGGVLRALIVDAEDDQERLATLMAQAQRLGLHEQADLAHERLVENLRGELLDRRGLCAIEPQHARTQLAETLAAAQSLGATALADEIQGAIDTCERPPPPPTMTAAAPTPAPVAPVPPAPVLAPGCAGDVSAPTDEAVDRWRLVETGAGAGADVAAVRSCVASIFTALIDKASTEGGTAPTDPQLQRFSVLAARAALYGHPTLQTAGLQALSTKLRALMASASARCATDVAGARATLDRVIGFAPTVASVDSGIGAAATSARSTCTVAATLDALVIGGPGNSSIGTCDCIPGVSSREFFTGLPGSAAPPVSMTATATDGASGTWTLQRVGADALGWNVDFVASAYDVFVAEITIDLTPSADGIVQLTFEDAWSSGLPGTGMHIGGWIGSYADGFRLSVGPVPREAESTLNRAFAVTAGTTVRVHVRASAQVPGTVSGSGRLVTFRLVT